MNCELAVKPLDTFPIIRSRNPKEVREAVLQVFGVSKFNLPDGPEGFHARVNLWQSQNIALGYGSYGARVQFDFPAAHFFRQQICIHGCAHITLGKTTHHVAKNETLAIAADTAIRVDYATGFEHLLLRINVDALMNKVAALIDAVPRRKLEFEPTCEFDRASVVSLRRLAMFFASELDSLAPSATSSIAIAELEQALITSFLCANPNNYTALIKRQARPIASWQVRRAKEYIESHWNAPITIEALAEATSASARSIFYHFKRSRGITPMAFVKQVRLEHAKQMLSCTEMNTVTEAAIACGFSNLGNFAGDYLKRFGERPSDTIKRAKGKMLSID